MPQSPWRSMMDHRDGGKRLPMPWKQMAAHDICFREGQVSIVAAGPGVGKTSFVLNYLVACHKAGHPVPTLYLSPDSDAMTIIPRIVATMRQVYLSSVLGDFDRAAAERSDHLELIKALSEIQLSFQSSPTYGDVVEEVKAYEEVHGYFPQLIVLDNTRNVYSEGGGDADHQRHSQTLDFFHELSRVTGAHCMALHHLVGEYEDGDKEPHLSALSGKVGKMPRLALNLWKPDEGTMNAFVAKNSNGKREMNVEFQFDGERQLIT